jgi:hypothetical protein
MDTFSTSTSIAPASIATASIATTSIAPASIAPASIAPASIAPSVAQEDILKPFDNPIDFSKITYKSPKMSQMGMKTVALSYNGSPLFIQTPRMLSFGINKSIYQEAFPSDSITFSFLNIENDQHLERFHKFLLNLDEWCLEETRKNSWEWLSVKSLEGEDLTENYYSLIKNSSNGYPDYFKIKLRNGVNGYTTSFFDINKEIIPSDIIETKFTKGSFVRGLLQCVGLWFREGKFGLTWKLIQLLVEPRIVKMDECLISLEED